jgi:hypothetical protein
MKGGWLSSHGCNQEIAFWKSERGGEPLSFVLLLLAWQIQERKRLMLTKIQIRSMIRFFDLKIFA